MASKGIEFNYNKLYEMAEKNGLARQLEKELYLFKNFLSSHYEFQVFLEDPRVAVDYKKKMLRKLMPKEYSGIFFAAIDLLIEKGREDTILQLSEGFTEKVFSLVKEKFVEVVSVVPLSEEMMERLSKSIEKVEKCKIHLRNRVDNKIVGGLVINIFPDRVFNLSLSKRINDLKKMMQKGAIE